MLALTDADPSMNIKKTLFKKDSEELLRQYIKSTTIPQPQKEKVLLALSDTPHSSNKIISIIEKNLGHKVNKTVPFLSSSSSSTASTAAPSTKPGAASSSSSSTQSDTKQTTTNVIKKDSKKHDTVKKTGKITWWRGKNKTFLVNQLEHRGIRLTKEQVKGGIDENGETIKMTNLELADMIIEIDNVTE